MLARFRDISTERDSDFVLRLIRDFKVATIPLSAFYSDGTDHGVIRLSFAKDEATLENAQRDLARYAAIVNNQLAVTRQQYDTQRATVAQDQATVQSDQAQIDAGKLNRLAIP